jgi:N6-L-threonylcarbamoyladenine synthase
MIMDKNIQKDIYILGIETSCDDTCASVVKNGKEICSNIVSSQNEIHSKYGGVVPEIASRKHIEVIDIVIMEALKQAGLDAGRIDAVSVTTRPGLIGSLLVGAGAAKAICYSLGIPLIAVNHLKAHLYSNLLMDGNIEGGFIGLIVSGGHSSLYLVGKDFKISEIGHTVDDAAGEALDKIARFLNLGYPGGPIIDRLSGQADENAVDFPRPMIDSGDFNFSFSGLKTSLIYRTRKNRDLLKKENICNLVASFQKSIVDVLAVKTIAACRRFNLNRVLVSGGVAANSRLRKELAEKGKDNGIIVNIPSKDLCMDNGAMVAALGYCRYIRGEMDNLDIDVYSQSDI